MPKSRQIGKMFPTLNRTVASYDPANFYIFLEDISEADLVKVKLTPLTTNNIEHYKTLQHEIRHSVDHMATLWGQKAIYSYYSAIESRLSLDEYTFHNIVAFKNLENQLFYSNYFTEVYAYSPIKRLEERWKWSPSVGVRFDATGAPDESRPIPFVSFADIHGSKLMRTPVSIATLLETNSVAEEINWQLQYINTLDKADQPVYLQIFENDTLFDLLYNQDLVVYNVAVHLAANVLDIFDLFEAFRVSSAIATLSLNLPNELVKKIKTVNPEFKIWGERNEAMLLNNEYGFIYFMLLHNYKSVYQMVKAFSLEDLLASSNLPNEATIHGLVIREMEEIYKECNAFTHLKNVFLPKLEIGKTLFNSLGICFHKISIGNAVKSNLPTIICNDTNIDMKSYSAKELIGRKPLEVKDLSDWYNISSALQVSLNQFYEIRGA